MPFTDPLKVMMTMTIHPMLLMSGELDTIAVYRGGGVIEIVCAC